MDLNLRPRGRWELALVVSMLVCVGVMVASEIGYSRAQTGHDRIVREIAASAKLSTLLSLVTDAETSQRGHLLTERANYLEAFERAMPRIEPLIAELRTAYAEAADPSLLADFDTVVDALRDKLSELELTIGMAQRGQMAAARELVMTDIGKERMELFRTKLRALQARERDNTARSIRQWQLSLDISRLAVALSMLINLALMALTLVRWRTERELEERRQGELDRLVAERTSQLEVLTSHLQRVSEDEKSKIARDLHDHLGAILTAAKMDISWVRQHLSADRDALGAKLARALDNLDQGVLAKRRIMENLVPSTLSSFGLVVSLRELAENMEAAAGWALKLDLPEDDPAFAHDAAIALFRIAQESINNAAKYASAKTLHVRLVCDQTHVSMEIGDDGVGFNAATMRPKSYGLVGMRQRMIGLGGSLQIDSQPGRGTTVRARLPRAAADASTAPEASTAALA